MHARTQYSTVQLQVKKASKTCLKLDEDDHLIDKTEKKLPPSSAIAKEVGPSMSELETGIPQMGDYQLLETRNRLLNLLLLHSLSSFAGIVTWRRYQETCKIHNAAFLSYFSF